MNALQSGRVAHAFLFSGPRGSGKTTTARILAKALNCHSGQPGEPCGHCVACTEIAAGNCMDVIEIDAASNTGVDNVRGLIEQVQYSPARDRNKIFIIDEVHMLSNAAFNALLKTLEEPPPHVVFIMATTEYHKIPATILSRCQQYSFKLIRFPLILARLRLIAREEGIEISDAALEQVAFSSGGSMRDAMSALDRVIAFSGNKVRDEDATMLLGLIEPKILAGTVRAVFSGDVEALLKIVGELVETGQDLQNFCQKLLAHMRNLMVLKAGVSDPVLLGVPESLVPDLRSQGELFSREDLLRLFEAFLKVENDLKYAAQPRFELEMGLIELSHVSRMRSLEELIAEFRSLSGAEAPAPPGGKPPSMGAQGGRPELAARRPVALPQPERPIQPAPVGQAVSPPAETPVRSSKPSPPAEGRELLLSIASATGKESLESALHSLAGAETQGDQVILDPGDSTEFLRRQIRDNMAIIGQAAARVLGRPVGIQIGNARHPEVALPASASPPTTPPVQRDPLERARRQPVVQSFLDRFPGPVKAEDIEE